MISQRQRRSEYTEQPAAQSAGSGQRRVELSPAVTERLSQLNDLGMTYAIINLLEVAYARSTLTLFTEKVAPALAAA